MLLTVLTAVIIGGLFLYSLVAYRKHKQEVRRVSHIPGLDYVNFLSYILFAGKKMFIINPRKQVELKNKFGKTWRVTAGTETFVFSW